MADKIVVHFGENTVTIWPKTAVRGVLFPKQFDFGTPPTEDADFSVLNGLVEASDGDKEVAFSDLDPTPEVCYWVGNKLVCW